MEILKDILIVLLIVVAALFFVFAVFMSMAAEPLLSLGSMVLCLMALGCMMLLDKSRS